VQNEVFAEETSPADEQQKMITEFYKLESLFSKIVYIVMYPLLLVA
jgi:hypothetical protein